MIGLKYKNWKICSKTSELSILDKYSYSRDFGFFQKKWEFGKIF